MDLNMVLVVTEEEGEAAEVAEEEGEAAEVAEEDLVGEIL
jgi:hypothetical protein